TALTTANISDTSDTFFAAIKVLDAVLASRAHEVNLAGLTANTQYEYEIVATGIDGDLSPTKTGNFKTRLSADVRPATISNINTSITDKKVTITWRTNRSSTTQYKVYARDALGARGSLVAENETPSTTKGSTSHRAPLQNLTPGTEYEYELSTRLIGVDDLITEALMTEAQVTATETGVLKTRGNLPPLKFTRFQKIIRGSNSAQITVYGNQPITVFIDYGVHTTGRPSGALPTGSSFDADPVYPNRVVSTLSQAIHTLDLTGLETKTRYRYRVTAYPLEGDASITTDPRGKTNISRDFTFQTKNVIPAPKITRGPTVIARRNNAWCKVRTNVPTTMNLFYGTSSTLGTADEIQVSNLDQYGNARTTKRHRVTVRGLTAQTAYKFRMEFTNTNGETLAFPSSATKGAATKFQVAGGDGGFGTNNEVDTTNPLITGGPTIVATTENSLTIAWTTDEPSTSAISYGTLATALDNQATDGESVVAHQITLSGLDINTNYAFQVGSTDISGNGPVQSTVAFGSTLAQADLTAPAITAAPAVLYASDVVAEIKWNTDELSLGEFTFGTDATNLDQSRSLTEDAVEHVISLAGLTANTTYYYQVAMTDANGNGPTNSEVLSFQTAATADTQAPTITAVTATPQETSAIVTWTTDEISDGVVNFGTDATALSGNVGDIESVTAHRIILSNLIVGTEYTYQVQSTDRTGNGPAESTAATFTTLAAGASTGPVAPADLAARAGNGVVQLTWAAPATDATSLVVERAEGEGEFAPVTTLDIVTGFLDNNVQNGTAYRYRLSANGIQGAGDPSTATDAATPSETSGPSAPALFAIQGVQTSPTFVINNSTPIAEGDALSYTFQLSTQSDFSDVVAVQAVASGAGRGAADPTGITAYTVDRALDDGATYHYRIKANDGFSDSAFLTGSFTVNASAPAFPGDLSGDRAVGFPDFIQFVGSFGKTSTQDGFNADADFNGDGSIGFPDFLSFVAVFNKTYIQGDSASGKPVIAVQFDKDTQAQFNLVGHFVQTNTERELAVDVQLKDVTDLKGYGIQVNYDPTVLEFVTATDAGETFLNSGERSADLFGVLDHNKETGELYIASAVTQGNAVSGSGILGTLTFRLLDPNPQNADINIAQGILFNPAHEGFIATNLGDRFSLIPTEFALEHNFPNPFNPETTLRYAIPDAGQVTLSIYNVLGQEVVRLVDAEQMPGFYAISWNGKNALGRTVASGVYLYRIQAGGFNQTHKMLLLK
ncbi:MAG: T9SS type A sorting domain-containing protein, partial [Candidatus Latescibacteria bacterium]|nr:T9SS type A sorting domain-containing protein [Candidatus Latescibacterota bacterium]